MSLWRALTVQAWLEVVMAMPMYMRACSENVKSGKVNASPLYLFLLLPPFLKAKMHVNTTNEQCIILTSIK